MRYEKPDNVPPQLTFDHHTEASDDVIYFAFTYPYTYGMVQNDLKIIDKLALEINFCDPECIYCCRELVTNSLDGLRIDLITISAVSGVNTQNRKESNLPGLFPIDKLGIKIKGKLKLEKMDTVVLSSAENTIVDDDNSYTCSSHDDDDNGDDDHDDDDDDDDENKNNTVAVNDDNSGRPLIFPSKEIVFISARVHPGEVKKLIMINKCVNLMLDYL